MGFFTVQGPRLIGRAAALPEGVTLQAIDGGTSYYSDNGFTYAVAAGWDDSDFYPIGVWQYPMTAQGEADDLIDLNIDFLYAMNADGSLQRLRDNNLSLIVQSNELATILAANGGSLGSETIGILSDDEPNTTAEWQSPIQTVANTHQDARFWTIQNQWQWINSGDIQGVPAATVMKTLVATPNATQRHLNIDSTDIYWCAGAVGVGAYDGDQIYGTSPDMTAEQHGRPCHVGDMVDRQRVYQTGVGSFPAPIGQFVENGGPYTENTTQASYIQPPQLNAAMWSGIIHGARLLFYFNHSFGGPGFSFNNLGAAYYQTTQGTQTISIYDQMKATNTLIKSLASVINSPFAIGYVTVSPAAVITSGSTPDSGFDVMAKWTGDNFYIFAMPRYAQTTTNQTATFTIANSGASQVTVINESRTISITGGNTFTDNFATGLTVHIYRVD